MDNVLYWLWLADAVGSGFARASELLGQWPDPQRLYEHLREGGMAPGVLTPRARQVLALREPESFEKIRECCEKQHIRILTPDSPAYPERLLALPDLPLVLYATGSVECLNRQRYVGIVGTRRPTAYGKQACHDIAQDLAKNQVVIVSGLADGLDSLGHYAAVEAKMPTIAFLGTPIDKTYPAANEKLRERIENEAGGCVLSEYAPGFSGKTKGTFLARNRLIAGQSEALCVVEARIRSGTLNTVSHAERYGCPVFAVPGGIYSPSSEGTNDLLRTQRAQIACSAADVMHRMGITGDTAQPDPCEEDASFPMSIQAAAVLAQLGAEPMGVDALAAATALSAQEILVALMELEFLGLVFSHPGRLYTRRR